MFENEEFGTSVVYFILAEGHDRVKIGVSDRVEERFSQLRTASPVPLRLLATIPGDRAVEQALHARFAAHRMHGEWFRLEWEIDQYISKLCKSYSRRVRAASALDRETIRRRLCNRFGRRRFFLEARELFGDRWRIAIRSQLGIGFPEIKKWETGRVPVPNEVVRDMHRAAVEQRRLTRSRRDRSEQSNISV